MLVAWEAEQLRQRTKFADAETRFRESVPLIPYLDHEAGKVFTRQEEKVSESTSMGLGLRRLLARPSLSE